MTAISSTSAPRPRLDSVQITRAIAATAICVHHLLDEAGQDATFASTPWLKTLPWGMGVDLFFIISGFIMMHTFGERFGQKGALKEFMARRLARIVPVYWFFTGLMVLATLLFASQLNSAQFTPLHALLSLLFVPHLSPSGDIHPILGLGWTLLYEMFFYLAFAVALLASKRTGIAALVIVFIALFSTASLQLWTPALNQFWSNSIMFEFLVGMATSQLIRQRHGNLKLLGVALLLSALAYLLIAQWSYLHGFSLRLLKWGFPSLALFALLYPISAGPSRLLGALILLGDASYTLYLSHPFSIAAMKQVLKQLPFLAHPAYAWVPWLSSLLTLAVLLMAAVVFYQLIEVRLNRWCQLHVIDRFKAPRRSAPPLRQAAPPAA